MKSKFLIFLFLALVIVAGLYFGYKKYFLDKTITVFQDEIIFEGVDVSSVIVPHFDYFKDQRLELLTEISRKNDAKTIVLVSVNHFNAGDGNIQTTDKIWQVSSGQINPDKEFISALTGSDEVINDETSFTVEHGIKNILSDIKTTFPRANIVPIIIKEQTKIEEIDQLSKMISDNCKDCLLVASVDFSHYCPRSIARVHDSYSIQSLQNLILQNIWKTETDSPQTLYLATKLAKEKGQNFRYHYNANSGDETADDNVEVTSVVLGYYSDEPTSNNIESSTSFMIAGDAMFDRDVWNYFNKKGLKTIFDKFGTRPFRGSDLSLLNLEGPISSSEIVSTRSREIMSFNFSPQIPSVLNYININTVSLANNHTSNAGSSGFANTKTVLSKANIGYFGTPSGFSSDSIQRIDGPIPISIIGIMALSSFDQVQMEQKISQEKAAGRFVIVYPHWGTEYKTIHNASQENLARNWIRAEADMIVGSHPHVVQDFEIIEGKPVIYSLGNFVFDQYFSEPTQKGLVLAGQIFTDKIRLSFLPTKEINVQPQFQVYEEKTASLNKIFNIESQNGFIKLSSDTIEISR